METAVEIWRTIQDYPLYEVSNLGRIRSNNLRRHSLPLIMHPYPDKDGHMKVRLSKDGEVHNFFVHRLVATAFIPNPDNRPVVNHKDENPANNHVENLEWCTERENTIYKQMPVRRAKKLRRAIVQMDSGGKVLRIWESRAAIEAETGFKGSNITRVCQGTRKQAHGFKWRYAE